MIAIKAVERRTAGAPASLIAAAIGLVAEICAASPLHDVAADRSHIAQLAGCAEQQCLGNDREASTYLRIGGHVAHPGQRSDAHATSGQRFDPRHIRQAVDVQQTLGKHRAVFHEPDEISAAGDEGELGIESMGSDRFRRIICSRNGKWMHTLAPRDDFGDGINDVRVAGAATQIAAHPLANLGMR